jgi:hypothetical protein
MSPTGDLLVTQFFLGKCPLELAQGPSCVALAWHKARGSTPFGVTNFTFANTLQLPPSLMNAAPMCSSASCCLSALILALSLRLLHLASLLLPGLSFAFCLKSCLFSLGLLGNALLQVPFSAKQVFVLIFWLVQKFSTMLPITAFTS